jgi:hypothetical protein
MQQLFGGQSVLANNRNSQLLANANPSSVNGSVMAFAKVNTLLKGNA